MGSEYYWLALCVSVVTLIFIRTLHYLLQTKPTTPDLHFLNFKLLEMMLVKSINQHRFVFMCLLSFLTISDQFHSSLSYTQTLCHSDDRSALLILNKSFIIDKQASGEDPNPYPKTASWKSESDCCSWDGVECDNITGHVIGLDLSSSYLRGTINSISSIFQLVHLQKLSLADNNFMYSNIPSSIANLSMLTYLDLFSSGFSGHIPSEISMLSKLSYLNLLANTFTGQIPASLGNLSQLTHLSLSNNNFRGGTLSWLDKLTRLNVLSVQQTNLQGEIPSSLARLTQLVHLNLAENFFMGEIPSFLPNLTKLTYLDLSHNRLTGKIPFSLSNLTQLLHFSLSFNNFHETSLSDFVFDKLTKLQFLALREVNLQGHLPNWLMNLTDLVFLDLSLNELQGSIPASIFKLQHLRYLYLISNKLNGTVDLNAIHGLKNLSELNLSSNNLSLLMSESSTYNITVLPNFFMLGLGSCNLEVFPDFLRRQDGLQWLDLSSNKLRGKIPSWMWSLSPETLEVLSLSDNFLTGQVPSVLSWPNLRLLDLKSNILYGSIPTPPPKVVAFFMSDNLFSGEIPTSVCNLSSLALLDLSNNNLSGGIPQCLSYVSDSLSLLLLDRNRLNGSIPDKWRNGSQLRWLHLGQNELSGKVPRSLAKCNKLKFVDLGNNKLNDTFPFWLGHLPIEVLNLRFNLLHGMMVHGCKVGSSFSELHIINLSSNYLMGQLPSDCFLGWNAMKEIVLKSDSIVHLEAEVSADVHGLPKIGHYDYEMSMRNKGVLLQYPKVFELVRVIDFSCNKFQGEIPENVASLVGLRTLNFSNNNLTGHIHPSLSMLTQLESLDLSQNHLSGPIPQDLVQLTFLSTFDVSHNHLQGPIPEGNQFSTFSNDSFQENLDLCGKPLSKKCGYFVTSTASPSAVTWGTWEIFGAAGYASGTVAGIIIGHLVTRNKHGWFMRTFGRRQKNRPCSMRGHHTSMRQN